MSLVRPISAIDIGDLARTYAVVREIGRGGMGAVVLARHREARHYVAIKIASTEKLDAEALARFSREAYLMARFRHPNIVGLYTVEPIGKGRVGIVMEYVRGRSLASMLSDGKGLSFDACTRVARDVGNALKHAHANGVIHRDVKPQNVLVEDETGQAKLADFGIAKVSSEVAEVTAAGAALGTPAYMSPEQIDGALLDGRSDIYSLGIVLWEMMTGQRPWAGEPLFKLLYRQKHELLPQVTLYRPDAPMSLLMALEGALAKDPAHRWASVADMVEQLESDSPTDAMLERRRRAGASLRGAHTAAGIDASTIPIGRRRPKSPLPESDAQRAAAETAPLHVDAPAEFPVVIDEVAPEAPRPIPPRWRQSAQFGVGLLTGGVVMLLAFRLFSGSPASTARPATPLSAASPDSASITGSRTNTIAPPGIASARDSAASTPPSPASGVRTAVPEPIAATRTNIVSGVSTGGASAAAPPAAAPVPAFTSPPSPAVVATPAAPTPPSRGARGKPTLAERAASLSLSSEARLLAYSGKLDEAKRLVDLALTIDPLSGNTYAVRSRLRIARGEVRDAWTDVEMASRMGAKWEALALGAMLRFREKGIAEARQRLIPHLREALTPRRTLDAERAVWLAVATAQLGDTSTALTLLEQVSMTDSRLRDLLLDPLLAPLRSSARFERVRRSAAGR